MKINFILRFNKKEVDKIIYQFLFSSGEGGIRTHATVARPNAFRVRPLITTWVLLQDVIGAGEGNRTPDISLGSWNFTIKLHPHGMIALILYHNNEELYCNGNKKNNSKKTEQES